MTTTDVKLKCSIRTSLDILQKVDVSIAEYEKILKQVLKTGYDINANGSDLLIRALIRDDADRVTLLFSFGAQAAHAQGVHDSSCGHAFHGGRIYSPGVAKALFDHIMASPHFDVIAKHVRGVQCRIDVFNKLPSDTDKAALYVRLGKLPYHKCSSAVLEICAKSGLYPPPSVLTVSEKLAALTKEHDALQNKTTRLKKQTLDLKVQLAAETNKLYKATAVIAQLTSL